MFQSRTKFLKCPWWNRHAVYLHVHLKTPYTLQCKSQGRRCAPGDLNAFFSLPAREWRGSSRSLYTCSSRAASFSRSSPSLTSVFTMYTWKPDVNITPNAAHPLNLIEGVCQTLISHYQSIKEFHLERWTALIFLWYPRWYQDFKANFTHIFRDLKLI